MLLKNSEKLISIFSLLIISWLLMVWLYNILPRESNPRIQASVIEKVSGFMSLNALPQFYQLASFLFIHSFRLQIDSYLFTLYPKCCPSLHIYLSIYLHTHTHTHTHIHKYMHTYTHTYTHTYICIYIYIYDIFRGKPGK